LEEFGSQIRIEAIAAINLALPLAACATWPG
jgi:hypothetical protein